MTTDLFDLVFKTWDRPMKEVNGYRKISTDYGYLIVANALGINKDNLEIDLTRETLKIQGKTEIEDIDFTNSVNYQFYVGSKVYEEIDKIEYELKDGLAYISIYTKPAKKKDIKITYRD